MCSYNQFKLIAFKGTTTNGEEISNGVAEIVLEMNVNGQQTSVVENAVLEVCNEKFSNLWNSVDLLILLLPTRTLTAGTSDWKAYACTNNWLSAYNNEYTYPCIFMHEIGHNISLLYSHDEVSYRDSSCLMGSSTSKLDGSHLCFNSAKSW